MDDKQFDGDGSSTTEGDVVEQTESQNTNDPGPGKGEGEKRDDTVQEMELIDATQKLKSPQSTAH